ncbi:MULTISPECIES: TldD/PmbA family protein [Rhodomicrobium]|uniref:TldD/PmbA family protein n=1 Tax=Rhodomicrobium TaxID=1068 RepID=UPI000B4BFD50|nr:MULTISPECIES: TldD/PmbA family protein [Rhodomicrobium]
MHLQHQCGTRPALRATHRLTSPHQAADLAAGFDRAACTELADTALRLARIAGAGYADIRVGCNQTEFFYAREDKLQAVQYALEVGFGVRVLMNGSWGFAGSSTLAEAEVERMVARAVENARASARIQGAPIVIEDLPAYREDWIMPLKTDPLQIATDVKAAHLLAVNAAAMRSGADFCSATLHTVREQRFFASTRGSAIFQNRLRTSPGFTATATNKDTGKFVTRDSLAAPRGAGWDYVESCDLVAEAALAGAEVREKLAAKSVAPGAYDLVIDPTNLFLTIHESIGHSTELDRALGWEADFAGTSFITPDKLGKLQIGSPLMTVIADRSQEGGLATVGFDDDGARTAGQEFPIVENGVFKNYQMAMGQAQYIGRDASNGCAYCDSPAAFPIQRMPNISLQPNPQKTSIDDLIGGIERGIYIKGAGSWSIDQQRDNFQFSGQLFYEIKGGKLGPMLRDVAYQSRTVSFWNAMDGLGDSSTYVLGGSFFCGKGQPMQLAPVSHGAPAARFRGITVLNTEREDA